MFIGESSQNTVATSPQGAQNRTAPTLLRLTADKIVEQATSPQDFIVTDDQKAQAALNFYNSGNYVAPSIPPPLKASELIDRYCDEEPAQNVEEHEENKSYLKNKLSLPEIDSVLLVRNERRQLANNGFSISPSNLKEILSSTPSNPSYKFQFSSMEALRKAAFGETDPIKAYTLLLARIAAFPKEHRINDKKGSLESYATLVKTEPPGDVRESTQILHSAISKNLITTTKAQIQAATNTDTLDELSRHFLEIAATMPKEFARVHEHVKQAHVLYSNSVYGERNPPSDRSPLFTKWEQALIDAIR